jgi:predicted DNA-binding helix-hairpin-helix protein
MEGLSRTLTQERAILVARQGDPKSPAAGTLLARQKILHVELESAHKRQQIVASGLGSTTATAMLTQRHPDQIRRDIRRIENELIRVQSRLREIDAEAAADAEKDAEED